MKITGKLVFSLAFVLLFIFLIIVTMGFRPRPRTVPMVVLVPALVFSVIQFGLELRGSTSTKAKAKKAYKTDDDEEHKLSPQQKLRREVIAIVWLLGFFASIVILGLLPTIPLFVLVFMRFFGRESWKLSAVFAASCFAFVYIVFVWVLQNQLYPGVLLPLLNQ